jgi:plastocyanin
MDIQKQSELSGSKRLQALRGVFSFAWIALICLLPLALSGCEDGNVVSSGLTVTMSDTAMTMHGSFEPQELQITAGQTVIWINNGSMHHTVTADDGSFRSPFIEPGGSYEHTFLKPGRYPYHCVLHGSEGGAGMSGVIIVVAASSAPAASS